MIRPTFLVFGLSAGSVTVGVLNFILYFYDLIPGQLPSGSPFYLRMSIVFVIGVPLLVQVVSRISPEVRPKINRIISLGAVLAIATFLMFLLLRAMTSSTVFWGD